jgi:hypothetical protein
VVFFYKKYYHSAIAEFTKAIELKPDAAKAYYNREYMKWLKETT